VRFESYEGILIRRNNRNSTTGLLILFISSLLVGTAPIVCVPGSMKRYGVRPSVCLSYSLAAAACGGFAAVGSVGWKYRSTAARPSPQQHGAAARRAPANAGSATFSAYVGS